MTNGSDGATLEQRVLAALEATGVPFETMPCDPNFADTALFCEKYGWPMDASANTIVVASKKEPRRFCACVVLATTRLDVNGVVRRLLEVNKASFASAEDTFAVTSMMIGGVTPPALPAGLPLFVDRRVMEQAVVVIGGGSRALKIKVGPELFERLGATVVDGLATEPRPPEPDKVTT